MVTTDIQIAVIQPAFKRCRGMVRGVWENPRLSSQEAK